MKIFGFDVTTPRIINYLGDAIGLIGLVVGVLGAFDGLLPPEYGALVATLSVFLIKLSSWLSNLLNILLTRKEVNGSMKIPVDSYTNLEA